MKILKNSNNKFSNYIKDFIKVGLVIGVMFGVIAFSFGIGGGQVSVDIGESRLVGAKAGLLLLLFVPIWLALITAFLGVITYLPVKYGLLLMKRNSIYNVKDYND